MLRMLVRAAAPAMLLAICIAPGVGAHARPVVEVGFVVDTTGSMGPLIEGAKRKIWSIATAIVDANPDAEVRMGLVAYRDIGDSYVTRTFDLTADIQDIYANLLEFRAQGGGDWPESVNEALHTGVTRLSWTYGPETCRILFLVGDAPPHMDYAQDTKYPVVLAIARQKEIIVNAVQAGSARDTERVWREIAQMGQGRFIPIPQDGGAVVSIETPFDREIIELQGEISRTVIPYGPSPQRVRVEEQTRQVAVAPAPAASDMASYMSKRARGSGAAAEAVTGRGDLVADVGSGRQALSSVKDEDLPEPIRALPQAERKIAVEKQIERRKALNERMAVLVGKRDRFIGEQRRKSPVKVADSFDRAIEETLKVQIKR